MDFWGACFGISGQKPRRESTSIKQRVESDVQIRNLSTNPAAQFRVVKNCARGSLFGFHSAHRQPVTSQHILTLI